MDAILSQMQNEKIANNLCQALGFLSQAINDMKDAGKELEAARMAQTAEKIRRVYLVYYSKEAQE